MASGLRWSSADYEKAQARGKFPASRQDLLPLPVSRYPLSILNDLLDKPAIVRRNSVTFNLPWSPTLNHMHMNIKKGRIRTKGYVAYCGMVEHICRREQIPVFGAERLAVTILMHWPNKRRGDLDNRAKAVLDSLQRAGVYDDDSQIDRLTLVRGEIIKGGLCVVTIDTL